MGIYYSESIKNKDYFFNKEESRKIYHHKREYFPYFGALSISIAPISENVGSCYLWYFELNGRTVYGRSIEDFADFCEHFRSVFLRCKRSAHEMKFIIFMQNAQDLFYFIYRNEKYKFEKDEVIYFNRKNEVFKFYFNDNFEVRSLQMLTEYDISIYADILQSDFIIDYSIENRIYAPGSELPETILNYYEKKTNVIFDFIDKFYFIDYVNHKGKCVADIPVTSTGDVKRIIRKAHDSKPEYEINREFQFFACGYEPNGKKSKVYDGISKTGFTRYNAAYSNKDIENAYSFDYDSFFPYILLTKKFPCEIKDFNFMLQDPELAQDLFRLIQQNDGAYFLEVNFKNISATNRNCAFLSAKGKNYKAGRNIKKDNQGALISADYITYRLTGLDLNNVLKYYEVEEIRFEKAYAASLAYLPLWYRKAIVFLYKEKERLKQFRKRSKVDEEKYKQAKKRLNRLYGVLIESPDRTYKYFDDEGILKNSDDLTNTAEKAHYAYQWGIYVTAHARDIVLRWVNFLKGNFLYCDVDCIKFKFDHYAFDLIRKVNEQTRDTIDRLKYYYHLDFEEFNDIGQLKFEGCSKKFKVLGVKRYAEIDEEGKFICTVSGLTDEDKEKYFEDFETEEEKFEAFKSNSIFECFTNNCIAVRSLQPFRLLIDDYNGQQQEIKESGSIVYINREFSYDFTKKSMSIKETRSRETREKVQKAIKAMKAAAEPDPERQAAAAAERK